MNYISLYFFHLFSLFYLLVLPFFLFFVINLIINCISKHTFFIILKIKIISYNLESQKKMIKLFHISLVWKFSYNIYYKITWNIFFIDLLYTSYIL